MSWLYQQPDYIDDEGNDNKIKPVLLAKFPFRGCNFNAAGAIDDFCKFSPGLSFIRKRSCLIIVLRSKSALFYTDCSDCLNHFKNSYTKNMSVVNIKWFIDEMDKRERMKEQDHLPLYSSLKQIREEINQRGRNTEENGPEQRSEDILKLIRSRRKHKGKEDNENESS